MKNFILTFLIALLSTMLFSQNSLFPSEDVDFNPYKRERLEIAKNINNLNNNNKSIFKFEWDTIIGYGYNNQLLINISRTFDLWGKPLKRTILSNIDYLKTSTNSYIYNANGYLIMEQSKYYNGYPDIWLD